MGCRPASQIQQTTFHNAMDKHMPAQYRHCIDMFADDMAAGADTLEELFEIYKALVTALDKAGIQVKASKVDFAPFLINNKKIVSNHCTPSGLVYTIRVRYTPCQVLIGPNSFSRS